VQAQVCSARSRSSCLHEAWQHDVGGVSGQRLRRLRQLRHEDAKPLYLFVGHRLRRLKLPTLLYGHLPLIEDVADEVVDIVLGLLVVVGERRVVLGE
jgi:hypothetical protein